MSILIRGEPPHSANFTCSLKRCLRGIVCGLYLLFCDVSFCEVPHITVVAANAVAGLRSLAKYPHGSYQVLLWRSDHFLHDHFKDAKFEAVIEEFELGGAKKVKETFDEQADRHEVRFLIQKNVIKSHTGNSHDLIVEVTYYKKLTKVTLSPSIVVTFGYPFAKAAAIRDYKRGTVLDRIFGIRSLLLQAKQVPQLDSISVEFGEISSFSSTSTGYGFILDVNLSDPQSRGSWINLSLGYKVCSGLEPTFPAVDPEVYAAKDILLRPPGWGADHEKGYPDTFSSSGYGGAPRRP